MSSQLVTPVKNHRRIFVIPSSNLAKMIKTGVWKQNCPVHYSELRLLRLKFKNFQGEIKLGQMVVHRDVAQEVIDIFDQLLELEFPIEKMRLMEEYSGSDTDSMTDNNTSGFCCRSITGKMNEYSKHSYGKAIDINPQLNPYVKVKDFAVDSFRSNIPKDVKDKDLPDLLNSFCLRNIEDCSILPANGIDYLYRNNSSNLDRLRGIIFKECKITQLFLERNWKWGGDWPSNSLDSFRTDFQHFEKHF